MQDIETILRLDDVTGAPDQLIYWISYLANHFTIPAYKDISVELDLSRHEALILLSLGSLRDGLTAGDIATLSGRPKNSISRAVASLEARKLIKRSTHATDRRQQPLSMTAAGTKLFAKINAQLQARAKTATAILSPKERKQLNTLLAKLVTGSFDWVDDQAQQRSREYG